MPTPTETLEGAIQRVRNLPGFATYKDRETHLYAVVYECDQPRKTKGTGRLCICVHQHRQKQTQTALVLAALWQYSTCKLQAL